MNREEFIKLQKKNKLEEEQMTDEEKQSLYEARRRHSKKVRDEILTSYELNKQKEKTDNNR